MIGHRLLYVSLILVACAPALDETTGLVSEPRILAVRGIPAEARPNTPVRYEALIAHPTAPLETDARFSY